MAAYGGNGYALLTWSPPVYEGGAPVQSYTVTASNGAHVTVPAADFLATTYVRVPGMANGSETTFQVTARNAPTARSAPSLASRAVTPSEKAIPLPAAPVKVTAPWPAPAAW